jgi:hypothetical protein
MDPLLITGRRSSGTRSLPELTDPRRRRLVAGRWVDRLERARPRVVAAAANGAAAHWLNGEAEESWVRRAVRNQLHELKAALRAADRSRRHRRNPRSGSGCHAWWRPSYLATAHWPPLADTMQRRVCVCSNASVERDPEGGWAAAGGRSQADLGQARDPADRLLLAYALPAVLCALGNGGGGAAGRRHGVREAAEPLHPGVRPAEAGGGAHLCERQVVRLPALPWNVSWNVWPQPNGQPKALELALSPVTGCLAAAWL